VPGGPPWDDLIYNSWDIDRGRPGEIDTAIGIDANAPTTGTDADGTVAIITLTALTEGITRMVFRPDVNDIESTWLADMNAQPVLPNKLSSQLILIDGTDPNIDITSAKQDSIELLGLGAPNAVQGNVIITVAASDALAGLAGIPTVIVTPNGGSLEDITSTGVDNGDGTFSYTYTVTSNVANGTATITTYVQDRSGNISADSDTFNINKNRVTGIVAIDTYSSTSYVFDRDVVFKATDDGGNVLKTWLTTLNFANDGGTRVASGSYKLADVPGDTKNLSAKTDWTLRRKIAVSLAQGQAVVNFINANDLLGGDFDRSNTINFPDYIVLRINWYTNGPAADITGDGYVNIYDYFILKLNWFKNGDDE